MTKPSLAANASPDAYAAAMVKCQGYAPACSDACECLHDGMCFTSSGAGFKAARRALSDMVANERDVATRVWLKLALDALDHNQFLTRGAIDALKVIAINKRVRDEYCA